MKTYKEFQEGLEKYIKNDRLDKYIDTDLSNDVVVLVDNKKYTIKNFGDSINSDVKINSDLNLYELEKVVYLKIYKTTLKELAIDPNKKYTGTLVKGTDESEVKFKIINNTNESLINERGDDEATGGPLGLGILGAMGACIGGPVGLLVASSFAIMMGYDVGGVVKTAGGTVAGAGAAVGGFFALVKKGVDKLKERHDKKKAEKEEKKKAELSRKEAEDLIMKQLALASVKAASIDENYRKDFEVFLYSLSDEKGNLDIEKITKEFNNPDNAKKLKDIYNDIDKKYKETNPDNLLKIADKLTAEDISKFNDTMKNNKKYIEAEYEYTKVEKELKDIDKKIESADDEEKEKLQKQKDLISKNLNIKKAAYEKSLQERNKDIEDLNNRFKERDIRSQILTQIANGDDKDDTPDPDDEQKPENEPEKGGEDDDEEDASNDDSATDADRDDDDDDTDKEDEKGNSTHDEEIVVKTKDGKEKKVTRKVQRKVGKRGGKKYRVKRNGSWGDWHYGIPKTKLSNESKTSVKPIREARLKTLKDMRKI